MFGGIVIEVRQALKVRLDRRTPSGDQDDLAEPLRLTLQQLEHHPAAVGVAKQMRPLNPQFVQDTTYRVDAHLQPRARPWRDIVRMAALGETDEVRHQTPETAETAEQRLETCLATRTRPGPVQKQ